MRGRGRRPGNSIWRASAPSGATGLATPGRDFKRTKIGICRPSSMTSSTNTTPARSADHLVFWGLVRTRSGHPLNMKRLSGLDAAFWFAETRNCPLHGGALRICDPSEAPNFSFGAVRDLLAARLAELPALRYRVAG